MIRHLWKKGGAIIVFIIIILAFIGFLFYHKSSLGFDKVSSIDRESKEKCILSPCDCKCYLKPNAPDINLSKVCTKDCRAWENIEGCRYSGGQCFVVKKKDTGDMTRQVFFRGNRYVPTGEIQEEQTFLEYSGENADNATDDSVKGYAVWIKKDDDQMIYIFRDTYYDIWVKENNPFEE
ncbi:hypothetical protein COV93_05215 [Candidatus Woesearchaeota archaeon CG11_big_fil_rev_8_21_14_0_20_43_8]|nr:MAG: hypothetical protein COV93_05215 [Candidatus Woesearchaeota archaeon CG11_big_fil_rev_8_21_14_0_20_43_8]PIO05442.1 MAG: hypothetical protein COT47_04775 [Candidatus Woesearchaeota archaeon CG08_land_8_20_14_0_20_43_7]